MIIGQYGFIRQSPAQSDDTEDILLEEDSYLLTEEGDKFLQE